MGHKRGASSLALSTLFAVIAFGIASNVDNLGVGLSYGITGTRTSLPANAVVALMSALAGGLSMAAGHLAANVLEPGVARVAGAGLLASIGLWVMLKAFIDGYAPPADGTPRELCSFRLSSLGLILCILKEPLKADTDQSGTIDAKEALSLGVALALNNVANGVPAGLMGLPVVLTSLSMGLFSLLAIWTGWHMGRMVGSRITRRSAGVFSGAVLVCIALCGIIVR